MLKLKLDCEGDIEIIDLPKKTKIYDVDDDNFGYCAVHSF